MKIIKKEIKSLGNMRDNNHLTERVEINNKKMFIKDALYEIGVAERSIYYKLNKNGTKLYYLLKLGNGEKIEVDYCIWHIFEELAVGLESKIEKKKYFMS